MLHKHDLEIYLFSLLDKRGETVTDVIFLGVGATMSSTNVKLPVERSNFSFSGVVGV